MADDREKAFQDAFQLIDLSKHPTMGGITRKFNELSEHVEGCDTNYAVCCSVSKDGCGATGGYNYEPCAAIALWNQRKE